MNTALVHLLPGIVSRCHTGECLLPGERVGVFSLVGKQPSDEGEGAEDHPLQEQWRAGEAQLVLLVM